MARGFQKLIRALAGVGVLLVVAQCGGSNDSTTAPASTTSTSVVTSPTAASSTSTTIIEETTNSPVPSTTTATESTTTTTPPPVIDPNCPTTPHGAVIDRDRQRAWLCENGVALPEFVVTTAIGQPEPGTYPVYAKARHAFSTFGGHYSTMTHFVAFTRGEETGARVAFHTLPVLKNGEFAQLPESVGTVEHRGDTSGCIRMLPEQGQVVWDWLQLDDEVRVIT